MKARAQEEKAKDTVLINGIGFVAACVSRQNSAGSGSDTRLTFHQQFPFQCQVDSEILRIHAMKDRALLAALQVPLVAKF